MRYPAQVFYVSEHKGGGYVITLVVQIRSIGIDGNRQEGAQLLELSGIEDRQTQSIQITATGESNLGFPGWLVSEGKAVIIYIAGVINGQTFVERIAGNRINRFCSLTVREVQLVDHRISRWHLEYQTWEPGASQAGKAYPVPEALCPQAGFQTGAYDGVVNIGNQIVHTCVGRSVHPVGCIGQNGNFYRGSAIDAHTKSEIGQQDPVRNVHAAGELQCIQHPITDRVFANLERGQIAADNRGESKAIDHGGSHENRIESSVCKRRVEVLNKIGQVRIITGQGFRQADQYTGINTIYHQSEQGGFVHRGSQGRVGNRGLGHQRGTFNGSVAQENRLAGRLAGNEIQCR